MITPQELRQLPPQVLIRLLVDGEILRREIGWEKYENRQPGCIEDFFHGLNLAMFHLVDLELRLDYIQALNSLCGNSALKNSFDRMQAGNLWENSPLQSPFRFHNAIAAYTPAGIQQRIQHYKEHGHRWIGGLTLEDTYPSNHRFFRLTLTADTIPELCKQHHCTEDQLGQVIFALFTPNRTMRQRCADHDSSYPAAQEIVAQYNAAISGAKTLAEKEFVIVKHLQLLEQCHIFFDANNRAIINLLGNRLYMQHGLAPFILDDFNIFDGHSIAQIIKKIHLGQSQFQRAMRGKAVHGYHAENMPNAELAKLSTMTRCFKENDMNAMHQRLTPFWIRYYQNNLLQIIPAPSNEQLNRAIYEIITRLPVILSMPLYHIVFAAGYLQGSLRQALTSVCRYLPHCGLFAGSGSSPAVAMQPADQFNSTRKLL